MHPATSRPAALMKSDIRILTGLSHSISGSVKNSILTSLQPSTTETEEWPGDTMNSTLHMCQRMCEVQEPLNATIVVLMNPVECLTTEEWQALNIHTAAAANPWMQRGHCMPAARHLLYVDWLSGLRRQYKRRHTSKMSSSNSGRVAWTDDWQAGRHTNKRPIARSSYCCLSSLSDAKI